MEELSLGWELKKTAETVKQYTGEFINECLEKNNISLSWTEGAVLAYITAHKEKVISAKLLLTKLQLSKATMSQTLTSLTSKGLIEYEEWSEDGRVKRVILTKKAQNVCKSISEILDKADAYFREAFSQEELEMLKGLLQKLRTHISEEERKE